MKTACIFPGQGAQAVGMGKDLYEAFPAAKAVFDKADEALGFSISSLCFNGPDTELRETINTQPALVTVSYACWSAIRQTAKNFIPPAFTAGHSLGEYTALAAAGVTDFKTAVQLSRERGRLMNEAGKLNPGTMAAVMGLEEPVLAEICRQTETSMANINSAGQVVISGTVANVNKAGELAVAKGGKVRPLQVSGAFHSPLMKPAAEGLGKYISNLTFKDPQIPIIGNVSARPLTTAAAVKEELLAQLCSPVQWQKSVENMAAAGVTAFIEIGPGKVLTGLVKRINKDVKTLNINDAASASNYDSLFGSL